MSRDHSSPKGKRTIVISGVGLVVIALVLVFVLLERQRAYFNNELKDRVAEAKAGPQVRVVFSTRSPAERVVTLVGEARSYRTVTLYAKVSGYLKEIRVDKGDRVKAGQVLAVIESPELNRQYDAARADAQQKRADAARAKALVAKDYISQEDFDHAVAAARESEANAEALRTQKDYEILRAPFDATVTARFADPGALVQSAVNAQTTALPVVTLSETDRLRVYAYPDQRDAVFVHVEDRAEIADAARPDVKLHASVTRISGELDQKTRTLLTELDVDNTGGLILPGSFVQVSLTLRTTPAVEIPADALLMKGEQAFVVVVTPSSTVSYRPVVISGSDGKRVRLSSGIDEGERVVLNPGTGILEGDQVQPVIFALE